MKKIATGLMAVVLCVGMHPLSGAVDTGANTALSGTYVQQYSDVPTNHWAFSYIAELSNRGAINGFVDGKYYPNNTVTRAQFAKIMTVAAGLTPKAVSSTAFADVSASHWSAPYIAIAQSYMPYYTQQNGQYLFKPDTAALREDIAYAVVKMKGYDISMADQDALKTMFSDYTSISETLRPYVAVAVEKGVISGYPDGTFRAQNTVTRAEAATILWRAFELGNDNTDTDQTDNPVVLRVGTDEIRAREYADAVANMVKMVDNSFEMEMDWTNAETAEIAQLFMGDDPMSLGRQMVIETHVIAQKAAELGVSSKKDIDKQYAESLVQTVSSLGGEEEFQQALRENGLTESLYESSVRAQLQLDALSEYYFGENGVEPVSEQKIDQYFRENYLAAKHILLLTYDPQTGEEKRTLEQALSEAKVIHARLEKGEDFDTLMHELSEDSGLAAYPDGYVFTEGDMVDEFYEGTKALEVGQCSAPIQSSYGYHIIQRQPLDPATQLADYRETIIEKLGYNITQKLNEWVEETNVTETDALGLITYETLYRYTTLEPTPSKDK